MLKNFGTVALKKIVILGFAFKANTNDTKVAGNSNSKDLLENGAEIIINDPKVKKSQIERDLETKKTIRK